MFEIHPAYTVFNFNWLRVYRGLNMKSFLVIFAFVALCQGTPVKEAHTAGMLTRNSTLKSAVVSKPIVSRSSNTTLVSDGSENDWFQQEFTDIEEAFVFPGSDYLQVLIKRYFDNSMEDRMELDDIKDNFELPDCDTKKVYSSISKCYKSIKPDPETMAVMASRLLAKPLLTERMKCPAAILDTSIIKVLAKMKYEFLAKEDSSLMSFFAKLAPLVDPMLEPYSQDIAEKGVEEFHGLVFNDTMFYLLGFGLKDVAFASHLIYSEVVDFFRYMPLEARYVDTMEIKYRIQNSLWDVRCPDSYQVVDYHQRAVRRFINTYDMIESARICPRVIDFLYAYVNIMIPEHTPNFETNGHVEIVCDKLRETLQDLVEGYTEYENALYSMKIEEMKILLAEILDHEDWELLEEALRRLHFMDW